MIKNYFKTAIRNLARNKTYSIINILGFAIGLTVSILLIFYIKHELTHDAFHENKEHIYRLAFEQSDGNKTEIDNTGLTVMGPEVKEAFPEVKHFVRLSSYRGGTLLYNDKGVRETKIRYADSSFFEVFSFNLLQGNQKAALKDPYKIVLSEDLAQRLFGNKNPIGKVINYNDINQLTVSGVVENPPSRSHIQFEALISFETIYDNYFDGHFGWNGGWGYYTYFLLNESAPNPNFNNKLEDFFYEKIGKRLEDGGWKLIPLLEPMERIYLHHKSMDDPNSAGSLNNIYVFSAIALFVLLIASINFMNMTTAQSIKRIKEVGVRKVMGATRKSLIQQFIGESLLITFLALVLSVILVEIFLPQFNQLLGKELIIYKSDNIKILLGIPLLVLFVGVLSGTYPAFFVSSYKTDRILKGGTSKGRKKNSLQSVLIVTQFVISIALIICSVIIFSQLQYAQNKKLGYNKENLISISLESEGVLKKDDILKKELEKLTGVKQISVASNYPGLGLTSNGYKPEDGEEFRLYHVLDVDPDYIPTLGLEIVKGRNFKKDLETDKSACLINESLAKSVGWEKPIGKYLFRGRKYYVIGVVKDFHFASLHEEIEPLIFTQNEPFGGEKVLIKTDGKQLKETLTSIQNKWEELFGNEPFIYEFVENTFQRAYKVDLQLSRIVLFFTILAIFIACLGLFGLTAFSTEQRTKEIGIRKAMGATVLRINNLIIKEYTRWVIIANVIAWPVSWYAMNKWLQNYAYRIEMHIGYFLIAALIAMVIAVLTVSYQSVRAAQTNPVDSLRYE